jgi:hypothetical protein
MDQKQIWQTGCNKPKTRNGFYTTIKRKFIFFNKFSLRHLQHFGPKGKCQIKANININLKIKKLKTKMTDQPRRTDKNRRVAIIEWLRCVNNLPKVKIR